ncbi:MAG: TadA family conjugal transfer-associated ATPase [Frankiales bacterium]|nr:TadA family conjugal transfer-associated ATPase [Frankiales bacterium]
MSRVLLDDVRRELPLAPGPDDLRHLARIVHSRGGPAGTDGVWDTVSRLAGEVLGAGPLEELLHEEGVTDVLVNGPGEVWIDRGRGVERSGTFLTDEAAIRALAVRLAASCGRRLDDASPYADARLPDGTRVHAVLPPVSAQGTCISLRVPPRRGFTLDRLVEFGALPPSGADLLRRIVAARLAFVVIGGTGTGKTSVLSALLSEVAPNERVVLVEDAAELRPEIPHIVRLEARAPNVEGVGAVPLDALVRQALRMRPDRLVVGEVRGREVVDLLAALNTGHSGGASTVHANRPAHVPARFEAMATAAGLDRAATHAQLAAGLDVVIALARAPDGHRRVIGVAMFDSLDGIVQVIPAYSFSPAGVRPEQAADALERRLAAA